MSTYTFAWMNPVDGSLKESKLLIHSLKTWGGLDSRDKVMVLVPEQLSSSNAGLNALEKEDITMVSIQIPEEALHFPFAAKVYASAIAESLSDTDILVWMDPDTIVLDKRIHVPLDEQKILGYCPVHLTNISALWDQPLTDFWRFLFESCNVADSAFFPMETIIDHKKIYPHFNAGMLAVRPEHKVLREWKDNFERLYRKPQVSSFYQQSPLYAIFVHQAVLAATILATCKREQLEKLDNAFNYPIFLTDNVLEGERPECLNYLTTCRYDAWRFFDDGEWDSHIPIHDPLSSWLKAEVNALSEEV